MREQVLLDTFNRLPEKAKLLVVENNNFDVLEEINLYMEYLKSPIEVIFFTAFEIYRQKNDVYTFAEPQIEIEIDNKKYIVDFLIDYDDFCNSDLPTDYSLIIECDGYEFHQKTKKQVEYDYKREYDLKKLGYDILRFSGREIYNNPKECIERLFEYLKEKGYGR